MSVRKVKAIKMIPETRTPPQPSTASLSDPTPVPTTAACQEDDANLAQCPTPQLVATFETWIEKATSQQLQRLPHRNRLQSLETWIEKAASQQLQPGETAQLLAESWNDELSWTSKIPLSALITEWSLGEASMSDRLVAAWIESSDIHRLAKLADQLVTFSESTPPANPVLKLMTITAALLGIMRPQRARRLLQQVQLQRADVPDLRELLAEAERWTLAGLLLKEAEPSHRVFWNNRLRNPNVDWNWETDEARNALRDLSPEVASAPSPVRVLFQAVIPNFWWELFADQSAHALPISDFKPPSTPPVNARPVGSLVLGSVIGGVVGTGITFLWFTGLIPQLLSGIGIQLPVTTLPTSSHPQTIATLPAASNTPDRPPSIDSPIPTAPTQPSITPASSLTYWRLQEIAVIRQDFPAIERLHLTLRSGTLDQALPILRGSSSIAETRSPSYQALLKWAVLDPPTQADVRRAVIRLFSLTLPTQQSFALMERLAAPGEPYAAEIKQMASILLTAGRATLAENEQRQLSRIAE